MKTEKVQNPYEIEAQKRDKEQALIDKKIKLKESMTHCSEKREEFVQLYVETKEKLGIEHPLTVMIFGLLQFYEQIYNVAMQLTILQQGFIAIEELNDIFENCFTTLDEIFTSPSSKSKTSFFYRLRLKYRMKRYTRNLVKRVKTAMSIMNTTLNIFSNMKFPEFKLGKGKGKGNSGIDESKLDPETRNMINKYEGTETTDGGTQTPTKPTNGDSKPGLSGEAGGAEDVFGD